MLRRRVNLLTGALALVAALFLLAVSAQGAAAANPQLCGETGKNDAFVITLKDASCTTTVTQVAPGTYDIVVHDYSTFHNFHLSGPGSVNKATTVAEVTTVTWTVTLVSGSYHFQCDAHALSGMQGDFTVTASGGWTTPVDASSPDASGIPDVRVGVDGTGKAVLLWQKTTNSAVQFRTRSATGTLGSVNTLDTGGGPARPQVAVNKLGGVAFAWVYNDGSHTVVRARTILNGVMSPKQTISSTSENAFDPDVSIDDAGNAYFVWPSGAGGVKTRKRDAGGALSSFQDISPGGGGPGRPHVAANASGEAWFTWLQKSGSFTVAKARKRSSAGTLDDTKTLSSTSQNAVAPQVGISDAGNAVFAWTLATGANQARRWTGTALSGVYSLSPTGPGGQVQVAVDRASGNAGLVWRHADGSGLRAQSRTLSSGGALGAVKTLSAAGADAAGPQVGIDSSSNLVFLWRRSSAIQAVTQSTGGTLGAVKDVTATRATGLPALAVADNGKAVGTWVKQLSPTDFRIQVSAGP
jgi:plastocyanin